MGELPEIWLKRSAILITLISKKMVPAFRASSLTALPYLLRLHLDHFLENEKKQFKTAAEKSDSSSEYDFIVGKSR